MLVSCINSEVYRPLATSRGNSVEVCEIIVFPLVCGPFNCGEICDWEGCIGKLNHMLYSFGAIHVIFGGVLKCNGEKVENLDPRGPWPSMLLHLLVLSHYKWPEYLETDFVFGSSSIGSVTAQFLAAFSASSGKTSVQFSESEESDPDWRCWSASQEIRNPSIRIIFPTIERVKNASCEILASKYLLCFSQKRWRRLRNVGMHHDAIPYPNNRVNHPMHVKVARRRFQSKKDASSFGWVYSGSHNFSAAAWGRPISNSLRTKAVGAVKTNSVLGSRLHVCNYELGIVFIIPPSDANGSPNHKSRSLDDIILPFVVPAPKYSPSDTPATKQAMREALAEWERDISGSSCIWRIDGRRRDPR